jgi:hypothetical protein
MEAEWKGGRPRVREDTKGAGDEFIPCWLRQRIHLTVSGF